jgi:hypothetical protein
MSAKSYEAQSGVELITPDEYLVQLQDTGGVRTIELSLSDVAKPKQAG